MRNLLRVVVFSAGVWMAPACFGQAGASTGEISGTVTDPAGAAIAGAKRRRPRTPEPGSNNRSRRERRALSLDAAAAGDL